MKIKQILFLIFIFLVIYYFFNTTKLFKQKFTISSNAVRPFVNVHGDDGTKLKIILLSHPFTSDGSFNQYEEYKKQGYIILGITSYCEFPKITSNKHDPLYNKDDKAWTYDYMKLLDGWLYCFREPDKFISDKSLPKLLLSESDFTDFNYFKPDRTVEKKYDFIYSCPKDSDKECNGWVAANKNWELASQCLKILCLKYKLKGFLVGRDGCNIPKGCEKYLETSDFLSRNKLLEKYRQSKFIFIPNIIDASPRILTEAMCTDLPCLVNSNILGGWKYVDKQSGAFFNNVDNISDGIEYILQNLNNLSPRDYYMKNFSKEISGKKFKEFMVNNFSDKINLNKYKYIYI